MPLVAIAVLFAGAGAVFPHLPDASAERGLSFLLSIICAPLLFVWCKAHAAARGIEAPSPAPLLVGLLAPVGVPYYFYRSMPWRAASVATFKALCYFVFLVIACGA